MRDYAQHFPPLGDVHPHAIARWRQFTLRDAGVLIASWCVGLGIAGHQQRADDIQGAPWQRATDVEWLFWGFCIGGVLAVAFTLFWQHVIGGREAPLSLGEWLAFYPV